MKQYTGMRKGISLVEMMIAVILFAALATIGLKYNKNFINTELQAMKARVAAGMEEGSQLTAAYKLYKTQYGDATAITDLNATTTQVMTSLPTIIKEMSTTGWDLNTSTGITASGSGYAFTMPLDANSSATSDEQYCAIWNHEFNSSIELNVTANQDFGTITAPANVPASSMSFCYGSAGTYRVVIVLP